MSHILHGCSSGHQESSTLMMTTTSRKYITLDCNINELGKITQGIALHSKSTKSSTICRQVQREQGPRQLKQPEKIQSGCQKVRIPLEKTKKNTKKPYMSVDMPSHPFQTIPQTPLDLIFFCFLGGFLTGIVTFQHRPQVFSICFGLDMPSHPFQTIPRTPLDLRFFQFFLVFSTGIFIFQHRPQVFSICFGLDDPSYWKAWSPCQFVLVAVARCSRNQQPRTGPCHVEQTPTSMCY